MFTSPPASSKLLLPLAAFLALGISMQGAQAQNLLSNPGFESGLTGWSASGASWRVNGGGDAHTGSLGVVNDVLTTHAAGETWRIVSQSVAAKAGDEFVATAWIRTALLESSQCWLEVQFRDGSGQVLQQAGSPAVTVDQGYARAFLAGLVAPANTASVNVRGVVQMTAVPAASADYHTLDDFELRRVVSSADRAYLNSLAAHTWASIDGMVASSGLPYDSNGHGEHTSVSNIGIYLTSIVAACELGFIDQAAAAGKLAAVLDSLRQLPTWHGFQQCWNSVNTLQPMPEDPAVSLLDSGNLAAGLLTVAQAFPQFKVDCEDLVHAMDWKYFYDPAVQKLRGGFNTQTNAFEPGWYLAMLGADSRMASFLAVASGVPAASWNTLDRTAGTPGVPGQSHGIAYYQPSWGAGGLFMQAVNGLWLRERNTPMGNSARNFAYDQILRKADPDVNQPFWGWSASDSPYDGYLGWGGLRIDVVTPHACALAVQDFPFDALGSLQALEALGVRHPSEGFYDAYDWNGNGASPAARTNTFLMWDQGMLLASLANYLTNDRIKHHFSASSLVQLGYRLLPEYRAAMCSQSSRRLTADQNSVLVVSNHGVLAAQGWNAGYNLGDGTTTFRAAPITPAAIFDAVAASHASNHSVILKENGTVWSWGSGGSGRLGNGSTVGSPTPQQAIAASGLPLANIIGISAGQHHTLALSRDGTVWAWGSNQWGQIGDGTTTDRLTATPVAGLEDIIDVAAQYTLSAALRRDGTVWTWGNLPTSPGASIPVPAASVGSNVTGLALGVYDSSTLHYLVLKADGTVWAWGKNTFGQLGNGTTTDQSIPVQVSGLTEVASVSCGSGYSLALKADGTVWGWGRNTGWQLGDGTQTNRPTPVQVQGINDVVEIDSGFGGNLGGSWALRRDGSAWVWGYRATANNIWSPAYAPVQAIGPTLSAENLLTNPDFESGLAGWTAFGPGWRTGGGADAHSFAAGAVNDVLPSQSSGDTWRILSQALPSGPGRAYVASAWIRGANLEGSSRSWLEVQFCDPSGAVLQQFASAPVITTQDYTRYKIDNLLSPAGTASIRVQGVVQMTALPGDNDFHTFDGFSLVWR